MPKNWTLYIIGLSFVGAAGLAFAMDAPGYVQAVLAYAGGLSIGKS